MDLTLVPARTALVVIDLQRGITQAPTAPHRASDVVAHAHDAAAFAPVAHLTVEIGAHGPERSVYHQEH